ncbi:MAG: type II toxin-antitoxin system RelE/ParE family toxin [Acidobacteria bacterium]|nr:type II toxin-antitoxin system RelE/ParE family toxin [Acidobacteriota bacterium]MBI3658067.1 type II toxin-antitoxin system RelE/ParE family toxin [Acidobacteriota bacterium]
MGEIKWSEKASSHLQAIHDFIAKDSRTYAIRFIKSLIKATSKLEIAPRCGRIVPEFEVYGLREVFYQNYRIVYRVKDDKDPVEILAVIHCSRDFKTTFSQEWELY